jgi:hypothetical protein
MLRSSTVRGEYDKKLDLTDRAVWVQAKEQREISTRRRQGESGRKKRREEEGRRGKKRGSRRSEPY